MGPFARAVGRRFALGCLVKVVTTVLVVSCVFVGGIVALLVPLPPTGDRGMVFVFMLCVSLAAAMLMALGGVGVLMWRRRVQSDSAFAPLGLSGESYVQGGRQYHGEVGGRHVDIYWTLQGPRLVIEVASSVATRMAVGTATGLGNMLKSVLSLRAVDLSYDPGYAGLAASGHDDGWVRWVLAQPNVRQLTLGLAHQANPSEMRVVVVAPGKVGLNLHFVPLTVLEPAYVHGVIHQLMHLAATLEAMPQPPERLQPSSLEASARELGGAVSGMRVFALGFAGLVALGMGGVGLLGVIMVMAGAW
jgi:hypothetical protein